MTKTYYMDMNLHIKVYKKMLSSFNVGTIYIFYID